MDVSHFIGIYHYTTRAVLDQCVIMEKLQKFTSTVFPLIVAQSA